MYDLSTSACVLTSLEPLMSANMGESLKPKASPQAHFRATNLCLKKSLTYKNKQTEISIDCNLVCISFIAQDIISGSEVLYLGLTNYNTLSLVTPTLDEISYTRVM